MTQEKKIVVLDNAVVKFAGDSGDGMQLVGTLFTDDAALFGNDLATFPDYPAEIRAPHNTVAGVSGFQLNLGHKKIYTPGDLCDVIIAMNPASLKANLKWAKKGTILIVDADMFDEATLTKAGYKTNPLQDESLKAYIVIAAPISTGTRKAVAALNFDVKTADKCRNMFALGIVINIFGRSMDYTKHYFESKFAHKPTLIASNKAVLESGYEYASTLLSLIHI